MNYLKLIIENINPAHHRSYKNGIEMRGLNMDTAKDEIQRFINVNNLPVEIFEVDVQLKSVSIRIKN